MKRKNGFTIIELLVVVLIVSTLMGLAAFRFMGQAGNARIAALSELGNAIKSTAMFVQLEYVAQGNSNISKATTANINSHVVTVVAGAGRPTATAAGIGAALHTPTGFAVGYEKGVATYSFAHPVKNCKLTYAEATGLIEITTSGCLVAF